ncbi:hypothetical protein FACS189413_15610 [Bacteroidia bacterium]|nr:hypothetical protein FACS189413_15610 [Bacteroidia bacterium]
MSEFEKDFYKSLKENSEIPAISDAEKKLLIDKNFICDKNRREWCRPKFRIRVWKWKICINEWPC